MVQVHSHSQSYFHFSRLFLLFVSFELKGDSEESLNLQELEGIILKILSTQK